MFDGRGLSLYLLRWKQLDELINYVDDALYYFDSDETKKKNRRQT